jgi:hypothetical protein
MDLHPPYAVRTAEHPDADAGRNQMFDELHAAGVATTRAVLDLLPGEGPRMLGIARSPAWARRALAALDGNHDRQISAGEIIGGDWGGTDPELGELARSFQARVQSIMALGEGDDDILSLLAVQFPGVRC